jgi:radical SAM protein with 4Fe4S-binding SPASM domain
MKWTGDVGFNYLNEPAMDKKLPYFVKALNVVVPNCRPVLYTNGDYLTPQYVEKLITCGVKSIVITRHPPTNKNWDIKMSIVWEAFPKVVYVREIDGEPWLTTWAGQISLPFKLRPYTHGCDVVTSTVTILADGRVLMCCCDSKQENVVGNIKDNTILEIWRSDLFKALRKQARSGKPTNLTCVACYASREE